MKDISKALSLAMKQIKGVEKSMTIGSGNYSYKGVSDYEVKKTIGKAMEDNGLTILPIEVKPTVTVNSWDDNGRRKQSIFTEVETKYLILHTSGESIEIAGYGHGVDAQDKGAGKATTYALKYALLYAFMVPTGEIDDSDKVHSDEVEKAEVKYFSYTKGQLTKLLKHADLETVQKAIDHDAGHAKDPGQLKKLIDRRDELKIIEDEISAQDNEVQEIANNERPS